MDQRVKVRVGNRKVMEMKQGSFGNENGTRGSKGWSSSTGLHRV